MDKNEIKEEFDNLKKLVDDWNKRDKEFTEKVSRIIFDKDKEIAELNRSNMNLGKEIYDLKKEVENWKGFVEAYGKENAELKKENEEVYEANKRLSGQNTALRTADFKTIVELINEQKLANNTNETLDKAVAEIEKLEADYSSMIERYVILKTTRTIKSALVAMKKSNEPQLPDNIDWGHDPTKDECSSCGHTKELHPEKCDVISCNCVGFTMKIKETKTG